MPAIRVLVIRSVEVTLRTSGPFESQAKAEQKFQISGFFETKWCQGQRLQLKLCGREAPSADV